VDVENPSEQRCTRCGVARAQVVKLQLFPNAAKGGWQSSFDPIEMAARVRAASSGLLEHPTKIRWRELIN
jgi:hypothetical protein